jgi:hypothetical protein
MKYIEDHRGNLKAEAGLKDFEGVFVSICTSHHQPGEVALQSQCSVLLPKHYECLPALARGAACVTLDEAKAGRNDKKIEQGTRKIQEVWKTKTQKNRGGSLGQSGLAKHILQQCGSEAMIQCHAELSSEP